MSDVPVAILIEFNVPADQLPVYIPRLLTMLDATLPEPPDGKLSVHVFTEDKATVIGAAKAVIVKAELDG